jgi:non-heme chloroperoxidase
LLRSPKQGDITMATLRIGTENSIATELYYEDHGTGRPVVLIHGWPLSGRSWENQVPALVDARDRVVTYDRRGFGNSSQPWDDYDYDTLAADLDALLAHLDLREVMLVGFSMGGGEVARYIGRYGTDRVAQAVQWCRPTCTRPATTPTARWTTPPSPRSKPGEGRPDAFVDGFVTNFFAVGDKTELVSEVQRVYNRDIAAFASPKGTLDCIGAFGRTDFRADLAAFTVPTLIIHGDSDAIVPFEASGKRSHEAIAGSQLVLVDAAPHFFNVTHTDTFNRALLDFLAS